MSGTTEEPTTPAPRPDAPPDVTHGGGSGAADHAGGPEGRPDTGGGAAGRGDHPTGSDTPVLGTQAGPRPGLGWTEIVVALVVYLGLSVGLVLLFLAAVGAPPTNGLVAVTMSAVAALGAVALAVVVRVRSLAIVGLRRTTTRWLMIGVAGGIVAWLVNRGVVLGYFALTGDTSNPQQGMMDAAGSLPGLIGLLLLGAVLVPIGEELLFRGVLFGALRKYGVVVSVIVSSVVFGIAHGVNVVLPAAIVLGVINAVLYERSRSIWPSVVVHVVNNAIVFTSAAILLP